MDLNAWNPRRRLRQMDIKVDGLSMDIMRQALEQARKDCLQHT